MLFSMSEGSNFHAEILRLAGGAVSELVGALRLAERGPMLSRRLVHWARRRLKALESVTRRLVMLLALTMPIDESEIAGSPPPSTPSRAAPSSLQNTKDLRPHYLRLSPHPLIFATEDSFPAGPAQTGPVPTSELVRRITALQRILYAPEAYAKRLARTLASLRAIGEPAPVLLSHPRAQGLPPELVLAAGSLHLQLNDALKVWDNSS